VGERKKEMAQSLSAEAKQIIIKQALSSNSKSMREIALANNIGCSTLHGWIQRVKLENKREANPKNPSDTSMTQAERFKHLQATSGQEDVMVGAYCRKHGLYPHQLAQWEADFMTNTTPSKKHPQPTAEVKALHAEIKSLKHIILRKDKVLAETVALLVLKKKAAQIWGDNEED
jgi:transposase-like protein